MSATSSHVRAAGIKPRTKKSAEDAQPVIKNEPSHWDFIAEVLYSADFGKVFAGAGTIIGWALTSPPALKQHEFNIVRSGQRAKCIFNYAVSLDDARRVTSFSSMEAFYKKMRGRDAQLPKHLSPENVAIMWEREKDGETEVLVLNMHHLLKVFRTKVRKQVDGAELLLRAFEHGLEMVAPPSNDKVSQSDAPPKRRRKPTEKPGLKECSEEAAAPKVAEASDEPEPQAKPASSSNARKRKRGVKTSVESVQDAAVEPAQTEETRATGDVTPPRKRSKTAVNTTETHTLPVDARMLEAFATSAAAMNSLANVVSKTSESQLALAMSNNSVSQRILEALTRLEKLEAGQVQGGHRGGSRVVAHDTDDDSDSDGMDYDPDAPLTPLSPRADNTASVEISETGRPLRQTRKLALNTKSNGAGKDGVDDLDLSFTSDEEEEKRKQEESESDYEKEMKGLIGSDTGDENEELDDEGSEEEEEEEEDDSGDDMVVDESAKTRLPYLKTVRKYARTGEPSAPEFSDSSPENAMHPESSMEDKLYNDDNDTLGAAPAPSKSASLVKNKPPPVPKPVTQPKTVVSTLPTINKSTTQQQTVPKPAETKNAPKPPPPKQSPPTEKRSLVGKSPTSTTVSAAQPKPALTAPVPKTVAPRVQETCEDVINSTADDDDLDAVDM